MKNSVLSGLTARGPGRSHPFHHLPQPLHVRWLLPQDPRGPEITAGMLEGIPLITVLHHSSMDSMDFRALPLDSLFATAEPADEAAKLSSTGRSYDEDTTFFIKGSDPLIERIRKNASYLGYPGTTRTIRSGSWLQDRRMYEMEETISIDGLRTPAFAS